MARRALNACPATSRFCALARDLGAFLQIAANDQIGCRRAAAVGLLISAIAAIEARDHPGAPVAAGSLGVDQGLHFVAPLQAFVGAANVAQIMQRTKDLGE